MVVFRIPQWSLFITLVFAVSAAIAQTNGPAPRAGGNFRADCGEDLQRYCAGVQPGGGRLVECLKSHTRELSMACGNMITAAARGGGRLRAECGEDLQRFCAGERPGGGRLVECLSSHAREVSAGCGKLIAARDARRSITVPSAQIPAAQSTVPVTGGNQPAAMGAILRASCGPDVQRLCPRTRNEGDVLRCLDSQRMELSSTCNLYFQRLGALPTVQKNIPNKKPPLPRPVTPPGASPPEQGPG